MTDLNTLTLKQTLDKLNNKKISLAELYQDLDQAVAANNKNFNIYLNLNQAAQAQSEQVQDRELKGVPIAVKDNFCTTELPTTAGSKILEKFVPPYESTVTQRLKKAGAVVYGKTNMDAWAHGSSTETSDFGRTLNPRNIEHLPGGSSGGSAAAVAGDLAIACHWQ